MDYDLYGVCRHFFCVGGRSSSGSKSSNCGFFRGWTPRRRIQLCHHGMNWCQRWCMWWSILRWERFSLVSWLCWGILVCSEQTACTAGKCGWCGPCCKQWSLSDGRYLHVGNAAVGVGDVSLNKKSSNSPDDQWPMQWPSETSILQVA